MYWPATTAACSPTRPSTLDVPATAPVFRQVAGGGHPDLLTIERGYDEKRDRYRTEIVVDDVRELGAFMHLKAAAGGWRVVVIDSIDELNRNAANALLKVLEEPPAQALIILVSHAPGRLLPTIRSRCRRLTLGPLDERVMEELLSRHSPGLAEADRRLLIRIADGSIGRALEIVAGGSLDLYRDIAGQLLQLPKLDAAALQHARRPSRPQGRRRTVPPRYRTAGGVDRPPHPRGGNGAGTADVIEGEGASSPLSPLAAQP